MALTKQILQDILTLLERVPITGKEAPSWCNAYAAIQTELAKFDESNVNT